MAAAIFISHASADDAFVAELRAALERQGLLVWVDSRELRGGDQLAPVIAEAIEEARQVLVVLSPRTINSPWVRKEIDQALVVARRRAGEGYRVIPLLLPGVEPSALALWFSEEPVGVRIQLASGEVSAALPQILAALGERLPDDYQAMQPVAPEPIAELLLKLSDVKLRTRRGVRRVAAIATLVYDPADPAELEVESKRFVFNAPLGPIEADELRWYLEQYYLWPIGVFRARAARIEAQLPAWGQALYQAALAKPVAQAALNGWQAAGSAERRFSVLVDPDLPEGATTAQQATASEAAGGLLTLPWELLHDRRRYLFQGAHAAHVRRRLPNRREQLVHPTSLPIRVLLVSPRPEDAHTSYFDHRSSALPLVAAVEALGELVALRILTPPTFPALQAALKQASAAGQPFDVLHFDGHGVYDRAHGLGALCFEDAKDAAKLTKRASQNINADALAALISGYRIPLVFLDACQSARVDDDPTASVAAKLLEAGVTSVVAMSHSVLVETARRFVAAFYGELARGVRVGAAMLAGQQALSGDTYRGTIMGAGDLRLHDWFVPVLYQEANDPQLITKLLPKDVQQLQARQRELSLGALPEPPPHQFQGRSRELLALERLLHEQRYAVVRGQGGEGKTTLAVELARWLVRTRRFTRAAFVSLEHISDARAVLDSLGRQLLPAGYSVAHYPDLKHALQPVERALRDQPTLIVLDNLESVLPAAPTAARRAPDKARAVLVHPRRIRIYPRRARRARRQESHIRVIRVLRGAQKPDRAVAAPIGERARRQESDLRVLRVLRGSSSGPRVLRGSQKPDRAAAAPLDELFGLCTQLLAADPATRLLFTTREALPAPFDKRSCVIGLGALSRADAIALVGQVLAQEDRAPPASDTGETPQEIAALVEAVDRHARALVLLAHEAARQGVRATTENLHQLMAELQRKHPSDRENSLYASVELSLRRMPPDMRERLRGLGVFYGGAHLSIMAHVLELDADAARALAIALIDVGLGADMGYGHLRLDPALPAYLLGELSEESQAQARGRWGAGMAQLVGFLYEQVSKDAQRAAQLTLLELPNLLALLDWVQDTLSPEQVVTLASRVEQLLAQLGRPQALAQATRVRETAARALGEWSHAHFLTAQASIERLIERGDLQAALAAAQQLLQRCLAAGEAAYPGAAYDIAMAHFLLGRVLQMGGSADAALPPLAEAQGRFQTLADAGNTAAEVMAATTFTESGDCLTALGRLDEATAAYEEGIRRAEKLGDKRGIAVKKGQLATVRRRQGRYAEALKTYAEARELFAALGEPRSVATAWHQIGIVHRMAGQHEQAEHAYGQSLAIKVQLKDAAGEASSLNELGNLYAAMGRLEEAAIFYRQAGDLYVKLQNLRYEGVSRSNLADKLIKLRRYDEARRELLRAIECKEPYGHAAEPWKTWAILHDLEQATGDAQTASEARAQAVAAYLAYRRAGGESQTTAAQLCALVAQAIQQSKLAEAEPILAQFLGTDAEPWAQAMLPKLQAILHGARDPALAANPALHYNDAAELQLLLEWLNH
jgi:tetratricopeptide (TPR) repeat protein